MRKLLLLLILGSLHVAHGQTIQYGISTSGTSLVVKAKPTGVTYTTSNYITDIVITIRWSASYGIDLGATSSNYSVIKTGSETPQEGFEYQSFILSGGSPVALLETWNSGSEYQVLTVAVGQTGSGTGTFELAPDGFATGGDANIAIDLDDVINTSNPFYQATTEVPLPITLASFAPRMNPNGPGVLVEWTTASETNCYGFHVQRKGDDDVEFADLPGAFVEGAGTSAEPKSYSYVDRSVPEAGTYQYRLRQVDLDGSEHFTEGVSVAVTVTSVVEEAPKVFQLLQNYPNPFNPETVIKFSVQNSERATLKVYTITGQLVATLFDDTAEAGRYYRVTLPGKNLATGVYFYRLQTDSRVDLKKMLLLR
jgi:hypothetical protein